MLGCRLRSIPCLGGDFSKLGEGVEGGGQRVFHWDWGKQGFIPWVREPIPMPCSSPLALMLTAVLVLIVLFSIVFFVSGVSHFQDPLFCGESPPTLRCGD